MTTKEPVATPLAELLPDVVGDIRRAGNSPAGVPTAISDLDRLTGGLRPDTTWVITGRSGAGKSTLALDLARAAAVTARQETLLVTTEEPSAHVVRRLLSAEGRVPLHHLVLGTVAEEAWARLAVAMAELADVPLRLAEGDADPSLLTALLEPSGRPRPRVVVLDSVPGDAPASVLRQLREGVRDPAAMFVAVVQQDPGDPEAQLRRLEQRADVVLDVQIPDQVERGGPRAGEADLVVRRHRHGPVDVIAVAFQGHYGRFADLGREHRCGR